MAERRLIGGTLSIRSGVSAALIHECHRPRPLGVTGPKFGALETRTLYEPFDLAIELATARAAFPQRRQATLPGTDLSVRRQPVFDEQELAARLEYPSKLGECPADVRDRAQRPCADDGVDRAVVERNDFHALLQDFDRKGDAACCLPGHRGKAGGWFEPENLAHGSRVVGQVQPRPYADLQDATACLLQRALAVGDKLGDVAPAF